MSRTRETVVVPFLDGSPAMTFERAVSAGVWSIVREYGQPVPVWCIVHRPTGRTLWRMRCAALGLAMLDELGALVSDWCADLGLLDNPETASEASNRARRIVHEMAASHAPLEDMYWPEVMR